MIKPNTSVIHHRTLNLRELDGLGSFLDHKNHHEKEGFV